VIVVGDFGDDGMNNRFKQIGTILFRIIAIPFSILWLLNSCYLLFTELEERNVDSWIGVLLSFLLPILLFRAALSGRPWRDQSFKKFMGFIFAIVVLASCYVGSAYLINKLFAPYMNATLAVILFFILFGLATLLIVSLIGILQKKYGRNK